MRRRLIPKSVNWFKLPMLIHYREEGIAKIFDSELIRKDEKAISEILNKYCEGKGFQLRMCDGRMLDLIDIKDAMWASAKRQRTIIRDCLKERGQHKLLAEIDSP